MGAGMTFSGFEAFQTVPFVRPCFGSGQTRTEDTKQWEKRGLWTLQKVHPSLCWGLSLRKKKHKRKSLSGEQKKARSHKRTGNTTALFELEVWAVVQRVTRNGTQTHVHARTLTSVAGGSSVSGSIAGTAETVPGLLAPPTVLTMVRHTPAGKECVLTFKREKSFCSMYCIYCCMFILTACSRYSY